MLRIENPADGSLIRELPEDDAASIAAKYSAARAAQTRLGGAADRGAHRGAAGLQGPGRRAS